MVKTYVRPPQTIMEVFENLPEGALARLINDQIFISPAPAPGNTHQKVLGTIFSRLLNYVENLSS